MSTNQESKDIIKKHKLLIGITALFLLFAIIVMIYQFMHKNIQEGLLCILAIVFLLLPVIVDRKSSVRIPGMLQILILIFVVCSQILGEMFLFYMKFPLWDAILHTLSGFLTAAIGFTMLCILSRSENSGNHFSPTVIVVVAFCFSMTTGIFWEFIEFGADQLFGLDMQKDYVIHEIHSVYLDPNKGNTPVSIENISEVMVDGEE